MNAFHSSIKDMAVLKTYAPIISTLNLPATSNTCKDIYYLILSRQQFCFLLGSSMTKQKVKEIGSGQNRC